jgi:aminopeptidase 2
MVGFYSLNGENARLATTRMAPIFARRVFPCFDEPAFKAEFTVTLIADKTLTCLSNMETASEITVDKTKRVTFARSPLMSTYLLALVVGDLRYIEKACNPVVRLYAPSRIRLDHSILRIAVDSLTEYREVFGVELPLRKMVSGPKSQPPKVINYFTRILLLYPSFRKGEFLLSD